MKYSVFDKSVPASLVYYRDLLGNLVRRDFRGRYRGSRLGLAWAIVNPALQLAVYFFVFRYIFSYSVPNYTSFIFSGIIAWNWFSVSLNTAVTAIRSNSDLISQPGFPRGILPVVSVTTSLINFLVALPLLLILVLYDGGRITGALFFLPALILVQYAFNLALSYIVAALNVYVRDVQQLMGLFLQLYFFLSPIFYDVSTIPEQYRPFYMLNPMAQLLQGYRSIFLNGETPIGGVLYVAILSSVLLAGAMWNYRVASYRFIEEI